MSEGSDGEVHQGKKYAVYLTALLLGFTAVWFGLVVL